LSHQPATAPVLSGLYRRARFAQGASLGLSGRGGEPVFGQEPARPRRARARAGSQRALSRGRGKNLRHWLRRRRLWRFRGAGAVRGGARNRRGRGAGRRLAPAGRSVGRPDAVLGDSSRLRSGLSCKHGPQACARSAPPQRHRALYGDRRYAAGLPGSAFLHQCHVGLAVQPAARRSRTRNRAVAIEAAVRARRNPPRRIPCRILPPPPRARWRPASRLWVCPARGAAFYPSMKGNSRPRRPAVRRKSAGCSRWPDCCQLAVPAAAVLPVRGPPAKALLVRVLLRKVLLPQVLLPQVLLPQVLLPQVLLRQVLLPQVLLPQVLLPRVLLPRVLLPQVLLPQ